MGGPAGRMYLLSAGGMRVCPYSIQSRIKEKIMLTWWCIVSANAGNRSAFIFVMAVPLPTDKLGRAEAILYGYYSICILEQDRACVVLELL